MNKNYSCWERKKREARLVKLRKGRRTVRMASQILIEYKKSQIPYLSAFERMSEIQVELLRFSGDLSLIRKFMHELRILRQEKIDLLPKNGAHRIIRNGNDKFRVQIYDFEHWRGEDFGRWNFLSEEYASLEEAKNYIFDIKNEREKKYNETKIVEVIDGN